MTTCRGICENYRAFGPIVGGRYEKGQKRCQICSVFVEWPGLHCPCCGYRLRTKPRASNLKKNMTYHKNIRRIE